MNIQQTIILIFCVLSLTVSAQDIHPGLELPKDDVTEIPVENLKRKLTENDKKYIAAERYLHGINAEVNHKRAFLLFSELSKVGDVRAVNALAGMLRQGFGIEEARPEQARELYRRAVRMGSAKAAFNLALMWKTGQGGAQDFTKAFDYAQRTLELGGKPAYYLLGYLYYKGLGTEQDYAKAVEMFTLGAAQNQATSTHFLAMCYLGGYGVEKNISKGKELMQRAVELGSDHAAAFIEKGRLAKYINPPAEQLPYTSLIHNVDTALLRGKWEGKLLHYDYGRQQVTEIEALKIDVSFDEKGDFAGSWLQSDSLLMSLKGRMTDSLFHPENMQYMLTWDRTYFIDSLHFSIETDAAGDTLLYGNVYRFSPQTMEPGAPVMIELRRVKIIDEKVEKTTPSTVKILRVYPNPFAGNLQIGITLPAATDATIQLFDLSGKVFYSEKCSLTAGSQTKTLSFPSLPEGSYALHLQGEGVNLQTLVICNP